MGDIHWNENIVHPASHYRILFALRILLQLGSRYGSRIQRTDLAACVCNICVVAFSEYEQTRTFLNYSWPRVHTAIRNDFFYFFSSYKVRYNERKTSHRAKLDSLLINMQNISACLDRHPYNWHSWWSSTSRWEIPNGLIYSTLARNNLHEIEAVLFDILDGLILSTLMTHYFLSLALRR